MQLRDYLTANAISMSRFAGIMTQCGIKTSRFAVASWCDGSRRPKWERAQLIARLTDGAVPLDTWVNEN